jgi:GMP synthase (glutamine-hydrolysing)
MAPEKVAILDAGAQYGKVIDRRVRELSIESDILPMDTAASVLRQYRAIIISGGPQSVYGENASRYDPQIFSLGVPVLGICYGMHLLNYSGGGRILRKKRREDGQCTVNVSQDSSIFSGMDASQDVLMSHGDSIETVAPGYQVIAESDGLIAGIENPDKRFYGVQFHPEVDLTVNGTQVLRNFLYKIAGLSGSYTIDDREKKAIDYIRNTVGDSNVLMLVSGGVDSTVCATLLNKAIGPEKIYAIHIDTGFMRLDESRKVYEQLKELGLELRVVDAKEQFYSARTTIDGMETPMLSEVVDPQVKRKIIGDTFIRVAQEEIQSLGLSVDDVYLAQGTLRPDLIESASSLASGGADTIKTHHNDTELVRKLRKAGRVIEPLCDYHKDEVRVLGEKLGLSKDLVWRHPFPGPGLAVRLICAKRPYKTEKYDSIAEKLGQFCTDDIKAHLFPIQTVGVQGDGRSYSYLVGLSGMAHWEELFRIAREIPKHIHEVNRVVYVFGKKELGDFCWVTPTYPGPEPVAQLQKADDIVTEVLYEEGLAGKLSQVPVISFPMSFGVPGNRSIAVRPFITNDFMTGVAAVPGKDIPTRTLGTIVRRILDEVPGISRIVYDLTSKPPGTTEWE